MFPLVKKYILKAKEKYNLPLNFKQQKIKIKDLTKRLLDRLAMLKEIHLHNFLVTYVYKILEILKRRNNFNPKTQNNVLQKIK